MMKQIMKVLTMKCSQYSYHFQLFSSAPYSQNPLVYILPLGRQNKFRCHTKEQVK